MNKLKITSDLRTLNILIVEDGDDILEIMNKTFQLIVNKIYLAENGLEAINIYNTHKPDIILTDIRMHKMDGKELIKEIRKKDKRIPIIVISAYEDDLDDNEKKEVQAIVRKPINFINLIQTIDECVIKLNKESK